MNSSPIAPSSRTQSLASLIASQLFLGYAASREKHWKLPLRTFRLKPMIIPEDGDNWLLFAATSTR